MASHPNLNLALRALIHDISQRMPEFSHIDAGRILVVAGEARRASRGTVKPLTFSGKKLTHPSGKKKPLVRISGKRMLYCITLRPLFFRDSNVDTRIATIMHELFHISPQFDGTLAENRRHAQLGKQFSIRFKPLLQRYLQECPEALKEPFALHGNVRIWQWLERPPAFYLSNQLNSRRIYSRGQLFQGLVRMVTMAQ